MKRSDLEETPVLKRPFLRRLATSIVRTLRILGNEPESKSDLQISKKELSDTVVAHSELQRINAQLIIMEEHKAEAIWLVRDRNRSGN